MNIDGVAFIPSVLTEANGSIVRVEIPEITSLENDVILLANKKINLKQIQLGIENTFQSTERICK